MAKQSGIHQIKGKIGEHSYYRQTGVSGGLIRSINQGLSDRVKTDPAYANTRLNNREFGAAADTAALLGKSVNPKFRPMILPFSQSRMAKEVLKIARQHTAMWGQRVVTSDDTVKLCAILSAQSKRNSQEFFTASVERISAAEAVVAAAYTADQAAAMISLGIDAASIVATQYDIATGQWVPLAYEMSTGYLVQNDVAYPMNEQTIVASGENNSETIDVAAFIPEANHSGHQIVVFVFLPMRTINEELHVLQEYCSFVALPLPANA